MIMSVTSVQRTTEMWLELESAGFAMKTMTIIMMLTIVMVMMLISYSGGRCSCSSLQTSPLPA